MFLPHPARYITQGHEDVLEKTGVMIGGEILPRSLPLCFSPQGVLEGEKVAQGGAHCSSNSQELCFRVACT